MNKRISPIASLILLSACFSPTPENKVKMEATIDGIADWEKATKFVISRQGAGLVLRKLEELGLTQRVPKGVIQAWKQARLKTISRHMVLAEHFRKVVEVFNREGVELIAMKGIYLSEGLYPEPGLRQFSDIDLLVKEEQGKLAVELLRKAGYRIPDLLLQVPEDIAKTSDSLHFPPMTRDGVSVEVHTRLVRHTAAYTIDLENAWNSAVEVIVHGVKVKVFNPEYQFLTIAQHLDKHFEQGKFQLTGMYDLLNMGVTNPFEIKWNRLMELCHQTGSTNLIRKFVFLLNNYFTAAIPIDCDNTHISKKQVAIFTDVLTKGVSARVMIAKTLNRASTDRSFTMRCKRVWFLFFPPASYLRSKHHLSDNKAVTKYYFLRIWNQIWKLILS